MTDYKHQIVAVVLILTGVLLMSPTSPAFGQAHDHDHSHEQGEKNETATVEAPYEIDFRTHPDAGEIVPDKDMVEMMFDVSHDGHPAEDVQLSYRVYTPKETFWFGTDFPVVEGTQLLSGSVPLPDGHQTISMILPIRGEYRVKVTARGDEGATVESFHFNVPENPQEKINLSIFLLVLFFIGGIGGFIFSKTTPNNISRSWLIGATMASGFILLSSPGQVLAHGEGSWDPHTLEDEKGVHILRDDAHLETTLFPQPVDVGEMLNVSHHAEIHGADVVGSGKRVNDHSEHNHGHRTDIMAESHFVHSEGGLEMASQSSSLSNGNGEINIQLFDGAPHYLVTRFYQTTNNYARGGEHNHEHGEGQETDGHHDEGFPWEAEMAYQLHEEQYTVEFHESGDPAMKWLLIPSGSEHLREMARHRMEECETVEAGATIPDNSDCYNLTLNPDGTTFTLDVNNGGRYRLFTQHLPREFDMTIKDGDGELVQPDRKFITGKGEYLGRTVKWVNVNGAQPPVDDIVKSMVTLLFVTGLGVFAGFKGPEWIG